MAQEVQSHSQTMLEYEEPERSLLGMSALERHILLLVLVLHLFDRSAAGVLVPVPQMVHLLLDYSALIYLLALSVRWLRQPLNYLALDTVIATLALLDETGEYLSIAAGAGVGVASLAGQRWPADDSIIAGILSSDQPRQVNDLHQHLPGLPATLETRVIIHFRPPWSQDKGDFQKVRA